ncbi:MAG: putative DNA binding domain-containing protein [Alistipes sp.]|nr:putative DNA binding domain-containing protein [Alistipes sp.]
MVSKEYFGEGKNVEFKREIPQNHEKFLKDIIAFSNSTGGKIILGIEDGTCDVYGIGEQSPFKLSDSISNMISDACTPQIEPDIAIKTVEDKTILEIDVAPGKFRPYYLTKRGKEISAYIRINGTSRPADARKLKELELEGQSISYDSMRDIGREFDEDKANELCKKMKSIAVDSCETEEEKNAIKDMTIEKLEDFGVLCRIGRKLYPTHAFELLTDNRNKSAKIQCALFKGTTRDVFIDRKEFDGPIYTQVDDAYNFVLRHIDMGARIDGIYRNDVFELPISAIREMVANAVVHRSYLDKSCVQVCIFDDRIEVLSPGMLYGGLDIETAKCGKSSCRNEAIAEAFHYMHFVEAWGTGLPRIINKCKSYGLPEPLFEEFGDGFKVTIFRKVSNEAEKVSNEPEKVSNEPEKVSNEAEKVSNAFEIFIPRLKSAGITDRFIANIEIVYEQSPNGEPFGQGDVQNWLNCSKSKATNVMNAMKSAGIITKVTGAGAGKYKFDEGKTAED